MIKSEFINRVMSVMNEPGLYDVGGASFVGADVVGIDRMIEGSYVDAWRRVAKVAPRMWLGNKSFKYYTGVIDKFTIAGSDNIGFSVGDLVGCSSQNAADGKGATFSVATVNAVGRVDSLKLIDGGTGYKVLSNSYCAYPLTGGGDIPGDLYINVTSIKTKGELPIPNLIDGTGMIPVPKDFHLLTKLKMVGWKVPAMEAAVANTRVANIQTNEWTRGSAMRPTVVIDNVEIDGLIKPALKYYSLPKGLTAHTIEEAIYVPTVEELKDKPDDYDLGINDQIIVPLAYLSAATVFTILEKPVIAAALEARAEAMLPGIISIKGTTQTIKQ